MRGKIAEIWFLARGLTMKSDKGGLWTGFTPPVSGFESFLSLMQINIPFAQ